MRIYIILLAYAAVVFLFWAVISLIIQAFNNPKRQAAKSIKLDKANRKGVVTASAAVNANVQNYLNIVSAHGPDSEEAKAFRLGLGSNFGKQLQGDKVAVEAFLQDADIIDETYRKTTGHVVAPYKKRAFDGVTLVNLEGKEVKDIGPVGIKENK